MTMVSTKYRLKVLVDGCAGFGVDTGVVISHAGQCNARLESLLTYTYRFSGTD